MLNAAEQNRTESCRPGQAWHSVQARTRQPSHLGKGPLPRSVLDLFEEAGCLQLLGVLLKHVTRAGNGMDGVQQLQRDGAHHTGYLQDGGQAACAELSGMEPPEQHPSGRPPAVIPGDHSPGKDRWVGTHQAGHLLQRSAGRGLRCQRLPCQAKDPGDEASMLASTPGHGSPAASLGAGMHW